MVLLLNMYHLAFFWFRNFFFFQAEDGIRDYKVTGVQTCALPICYYDAYYLKAQQVRTLILRDYDRAFERVDVVVMPTSPTPAFKIGERVTDPLQMYQIGRASCRERV